MKTLRERLCSRAPAQEREARSEPAAPRTLGALRVDHVFGALEHSAHYLSPMSVPTCELKFDQHGNTSD